MAKIIVVEGPDRVGKATQCKFLLDHLTRLDLKAKIIEVPVHDNLTYRIIYWMLETGWVKKFPKAFQLLQHYNRKIFQLFKLPSLEKNYDYIIMDRWSLSTIIYGAASHLPKAYTEKLYKQLREPDYTLVLLGNSHPHDAEDVYEKDSNLQLKVREFYRQWAESKPENTAIINCNDTREKVFYSIIERLIHAAIIKSEEI